MGLPQTLIHSESVRLSNELHHNGYDVDFQLVEGHPRPYPRWMANIIITKIQLIDLEIKRRDKNAVLA